MIKHRNIKVVTTERRKKYLVSERNFHITKFFVDTLLSVEMTKILDLSKTVMYEF